MITQEIGRRIIGLRNRITANFTSEDWEEVAFLSSNPEIVTGHPRLLRSLNFGDEDYGGNILQVLGRLARDNIANLDLVDEVLERKYPDITKFVSAKPAQRKLTFAPHVFEVPDLTVEQDLVAVMMPFSSAFTPVYEVLKAACKDAGLRCLRADDIWNHSTIIQDIFTLILRSRIVISDFTGRNPNVMYETGIAHTLGKIVVPVTQSIDDAPFDMRHHRVLKYLPNNEGYVDLHQQLSKKLKQHGIQNKLEEESCYRY